jgi:hypothetical protein
MVLQRNLNLILGCHGGLLLANGSIYYAQCKKMINLYLSSLREVFKLLD